ncbi:MAG: Clp protease N-terminal domain-containing protein [Mucilaginibacter sp.]
MESKFSERAKSLIKLSRFIAIEINNSRIESEHFLLAIIKDPLNREGNKNRAFFILESLKVDTNELEIELFRFLSYLHEKNVVEGIEGPILESHGSMPISKAFETALKSSYLDAKKLGNDTIGSEHILLSILRDENVFFSEVLSKFNINYELVNDFIKDNISIISSIKELDPKDENIKDTQSTNTSSVLEETTIEEHLRKTKERISKLKKKATYEKENSPLELIFSRDDFSNDEIKEIIGLLSELYSGIGGDYLKIIGMSQFECKIELA